MKKICIYGSIVLILVQGCQSSEQNNKQELSMKKELIQGKDHLIHEVEIEELVPCEPGSDSIVAFSFEDELVKVQVVSYLHTRQDRSEDDDESAITSVEKNGKIGFNEFNEVIQLDENQIQTLYRIIRSYGENGYLTGADCYNPHHCVHFLGKEDQLLGYLEVCFLCASIHASHGELRLTCDSQMYKMKSFFNEIGIRAFLNH